MTRLLIDQKKNFENRHGFNYRSSGQFYFIYDQPNQVCTTISIFNYFKIKNNLEVAVAISLRRRDGSLAKRINTDFHNKSVINIDHTFLGLNEAFEGSLEVEFFCLKNLTIPYAAIIAIYETLNGITYVHTYSRNYSQHELEAAFTVTESKESNWTIRDNERWESFVVIHNGSSKIEPQEMKIVLTHEDGRVLSRTFTYRSLEKYETAILKPSAVIPEISDWLRGGLANCSLQFKVSGAFTRSLIGNRSKDLTDMQVTHSNFAYNFHKTDVVSSSSGFNSFPKLASTGAINIYPDSMSGEYTLSFGNRGSEYHKVMSYSSGEYYSQMIDAGQISTLKVEAHESGKLPSRFVIGYAGISDKGSAQGLIPFEISLGIFTNQRPKKRFWWGPIGSGAFQNRICAGIIEDIYGKYQNEDVFIRIYNSKDEVYKEIFIDGETFMKAGFTYELTGQDLREVDKFGYYTFYSDYPGFFVFGVTSKPTGSLAVEHGF